MAEQTSLRRVREVINKRITRTISAGFDPLTRYKSYFGGIFEDIIDRRTGLVRPIKEARSRVISSAIKAGQSESFIRSNVDIIIKTAFDALRSSPKTTFKEAKKRTLGLIDRVRNDIIDREDRAGAVNVDGVWMIPDDNGELKPFMSIRTRTDSEILEFIKEAGYIDNSHKVSGQRTRNFYNELLMEMGIDLPPEAS